MDDYREKCIKKNERFSILPFIGYLIIAVPIFALIASVLAVHYGLITQTKDSDYVGLAALIVAGVALLSSWHSLNIQPINASQISLSESQFEKEIQEHEKEIQRFETSIDKFYLPLMNVLSCPSGNVVDFVKLNEINSHRYLAKKCILCYYVPFYNECVETTQYQNPVMNVKLKITRF